MYLHIKNLLILKLFSNKLNKKTNSKSYIKGLKVENANRASQAIQAIQVILMQIAMIQ